MKVVTEFMNKFFSDSTPDAFKDAVAEKINEARSNGVALYSDDSSQLVFADVDGSIAIEDKLFNEVTMVSEDPTTGEYSMEAFSATQPDVLVPRTEGEDGSGVEDPDSTLDGVESTQLTGIVNKDKAGVGKSFSFTSEELAQVAFSANELEELADEVAAYADADSAIELSELADQYRAYSVMAKSMGHDTTDLIDRCDLYSELANEVIESATMNQSVTEYFSDMTEDEMDAYFSELDELTADALYSAIALENETGEVVTFSDVEDYIQGQRELNMSITEYFSDMSEDEINEFFSELDEEVADTLYSALETEAESGEVITFSDVNEYLQSQMELNTSVTEYFSNMTIDEVNEFFSELDEDVADTLYSAIETEAETGETITFSDVNEYLQESNQSFTEIFSDMTEDEMDAYFSELSEAQLDEVNQMFSEVEQGELVTYSDYMDRLTEVAEGQVEFSEEDLLDLAHNATELDKAYSDLVDESESLEDKEELAKATKVLADDTLEAAEAAYSAGHDVDDVIEMCELYSETASEILDQLGSVADRDQVYSQLENDTEGEERQFSEGEDHQVVEGEERQFSDSNSMFRSALGANDPVVGYNRAKVYEPEVDYTPSATEDTMKLFADTSVSSVNSNPCFTSKINN